MKIIIKFCVAMLIVFVFGCGINRETLEHLSRLNTSCIPLKADGYLMLGLKTIAIGRDVKFDTCCLVNGEIAHAIFPDQRKILLLEEVSRPLHEVTSKINAFSSVGYSVYTIIYTEPYQASRNIELQQKINQWFNYTNEGE